MFLPSFNHTPENNMKCRVEEVTLHLYQSRGVSSFFNHTPENNMNCRMEEVTLHLYQSNGVSSFF